MSTRVLLAQLHPFEELARDPVLTVACVLLIVASVVWVIVARLIARDLRRDAQSRRRVVRRPRPPRDVWGSPP